MTRFSRGSSGHLEHEGSEDLLKKVHTVGYWDKPDNKDIKNWMGVVTRSRSTRPSCIRKSGLVISASSTRRPATRSGCTAR